MVLDTAAHFDQSFEDALDALESEPACSEYDLDREDLRRCVSELPLRYTRYEGDALRGEGAQQATHSTHHLFRLVEARQERPDLFSPFDEDELRADLRERVGPVMIRDAASHFTDGATRGLKVVFFPRVGLDTTFFRHLAHTDVPGRAFPSSLDAFAALGLDRARHFALDAERQQQWSESYREALDALVANEDHRLANTDIYQSWLAVLLTLARAHQLDEAPMPTFFGALADLAERVYVDLSGDPEGPQLRWNWNEDTLNVARIARDLARIAEAEVSQAELSDEDLHFIQFLGARLEAITLGLQPDRWTQVSGGSRAEDGVLLATDIHTNAERGEALQIAVGKLLDLDVLVPHRGGASIAQGGTSSFYEFAHPASDRLTVQDWAAMLRGDDPPTLPAWSQSFVEEAP